MQIYIIYFVTYFTLICYTKYCIALHCIALRCVALRCVALRCAALRCVILGHNTMTQYEIALHCRPIASQYFVNKLENSTFQNSISGVNKNTRE